jgi:dUTP pyrophosphatase
MIISTHQKVNWEEVEILSETVRGAGGYGHTGL